MRFDIGFFARPAVEEGGHLLLVGDCTEFFMFHWREKTFGDLFEFKVYAEVFNIHADFSFVCDRYQNVVA